MTKRDSTDEAKETTTENREPSFWPSSDLFRDDLPTMSLVDHLAELRWRVLSVVVAMAGGAVIGWLLVPSFLAYLAGFTGTLYFFSPSEAFFSHLKMSVVVGVALGSPIALWQGWRFMLPGLYPGEREVLSRYTPFVFLLFGLGVCFGFFIVFPIALGFFLAFDGGGLVAYPSIRTMLSFFISTTVPFGFVFQLPLVIIGLCAIGVVTPAALRAARKQFYFGATVAAAVLTPADVASMIMMAIPLLILYEIGIAVSSRWGQDKL